MKIPRYIVVIAALCVVSLIVVSLAYVWFPEMVGADMFLRVLMSFAVIVLGSVALAVLGRLMSGGSEK
jgi:hypothetical protein